MAECKQCGKEYVAKRSTSAYCGPKCKQDFYRNRMKPVSVTSETLKPKSVTVTNAKPVTVTSFTDLPNTETVPPVEQVRYKLPSVKVSAKPQSHSPMMVGYVPPKN